MFFFGINILLALIFVQNIWLKIEGNKGIA